MIAARLQRGDEVRIVSPAVSLGFIPEDQQLTARERLEGLGLRCSFSTNAEVMDRFDSSPVEARVSDLHDAFADPGVKGILTTLGGYNSNALLEYLDYDLIRVNPKIFCGFSDITALATAIHARTGLVTYSGPHFTTFGMKRGIDYTREYFERCLMREEPFEVLPADHWSDDLWYEDLEGIILLLEDDEEVDAVHFDRELQSLIHQPGFEGMRGIVFGKFQRASNMDQETLMAIVESKRELDGMPVVAGASFGHTTPQFTFPIGGYGSLRAEEGTVRLSIDVH